jgi:hypothetical protein
MFVGQNSKRLPEFIQQDCRIDLCSSDTLTSIAAKSFNDFDGTVPAFLL